MTMGLAGWMVATGVLCSQLSFSETVGIPPVRLFSIEDVGNISPGFRLGFDPLGRVSVTYYNEYLVLNDNEWIRLSEDGDEMEHALSHVAYSNDGTPYFSSHGHWGVLNKNEQGYLFPVSISPSERPEWTFANEFDKITFHDTGVIFYNWNGLVYLDTETGEQKFLKIRGLEQVLSFRGDIYVTIVSVGIRRIDLGKMKLEFVEVEPYSPVALKKGVKVARNSILFSHPGRGFLVYNGKSLKEWKTQLDSLGSQNIADFCYLSEGNLAVALDGEGIFVLSQDGNILTALTNDEFRRVKQIVTNEQGIFWFSTDSSIGKVHYGSGITTIGKRSGLQVGWPQVYNWEKGYLAVSDSTIYESETNDLTGVVQFRPVLGQPDGLNLTAVPDDEFLLIGNAGGIVRGKPGHFEPILTDIDVARIVVIKRGFCMVIGSSEITAIRFDGRKWVECVDRISGFGFPSIVHQVGESVWIELGPNRVVRLKVENDQIDSILFQDFPWDKPAWVNIGVIDNTVIMSGRGSDRVYFDESTGEICESSELDALFSKSPFGVWRSINDSFGNIWLSHNHGVSMFSKTENDYQFEFGFAGIIKEPTPTFQILNEGEIWVSARSSLYRVQPQKLVDLQSNLKPILDIVKDVGSGRSIPFSDDIVDLGNLDYESNNLSFRFFSGTYLLPSLEYKVEVKNSYSKWNLLDANSHITIPNLKEGSYQLKVELVDSGVGVGEPLIVFFVIEPPWYRNSLAYFLYFIGLVIVASLMASVPVFFIRNRNKMLSRLVNERTYELRETMEKLRLEELNSAVHEERNRIANEIHDSVQQGLSGLKLILDSLLKHDNLSNVLKNGLGKAKTILAFTHQEVHHAVWDMETTILEDGNLYLALEKIAELVNSKSRHIEIVEIGTPVRLPTATNHHLLRIAQESTTNAISHGDAKTITVALNYRDNDLVVTITDDGSGFDVDRATNSNHQLGLRGILSRVEKIKGIVDIKSEIDKGTVITITVPISKLR